MQILINTVRSRISSILFPGTTRVRRLLHSRPRRPGRFKRGAGWFLFGNLKGSRASARQQHMLLRLETISATDLHLRRSVGISHGRRHVPAATRHPQDLPSRCIFQFFRFLLFYAKRYLSVFFFSFYLISSPK